MDVIKGEDQAEFDRHREALLKELRPDGAVESMLAERVVSLSWRLERVGRMQNEVFEALLAKESTPLAKLARSMIPGKAAEDDGLDLGRAAIKDFANSRVLDRLLMYERRIEHSPLKTLNDLQLRRLRVREYISRQMDEIGSPEAGSSKCEVSSWKSDKPGFESSSLQTSNWTLQTCSDPCHSSIPSFQDSTDVQDGSGAEEQSRKTKPISLGTNNGQVPWGEEVTGDLQQDESPEAKPISSAQEVSSLKCQVSSEESQAASLPTSNFTLQT